VTAKGASVTVVAVTANADAIAFVTGNPEAVPPAADGPFIP